jgi:hypothetical protein
MPYRKVQFYAFNIKTNPPYTVTQGGAEREIILRIQALVEAALELRRAQDRDTQRDPELLNVLVAPEFYHRPAGGTYNYDDTFRMTLQQNFSGFGYKELENWLIVGGTIMSADKSIYDGYYVGRNTCLVVHGRQQAWRIFEKQNVSNIDGMSSYLQGNYQAYILNNERMVEYMKQAYPSVFPIDNVSFGVEICLDHALGVLKKAKSIADIHIITACGMEITPAQIVGTKYVFRVDGQNYGVRNIAPSSLWANMDSKYVLIPPQVLNIPPTDQNFIGKLGRPVVLEKYGPFPL